MSEWQPIETAPKDGTEVLAYCVDGGDGVGYISVIFFDSICLGYEPEWLSVYAEPIEYSVPTHWMPLPPPPEK